MGDKEVVNFIFELGTLKNVDRSGWRILGKKNVESVAEHVFRTSIVGYIIAKKEGVNADKVMRICMLHDVSEARINDLHKINQRYIELKDAENKAFEEQMEKLDDEIKTDLKATFEEFQKRESPEAIIAKDADLLECAFQAKEYYDQGYIGAQDWINNVEKLLRTETAKSLLQMMKKTSSMDWWQGLKKID